MISLEICIANLLKQGLSKKFLVENAETIQICAAAMSECPLVKVVAGNIVFEWSYKSFVLLLEFERGFHYYRLFMTGKRCRKRGSFIERFASDPNEFDIKGAFIWLDKRKK